MNKERKAHDDSRYASLRANAERVLARLGAGQQAEGTDLSGVFQELQVHQIELEMQNDELRIANEELEIQRMKFEGIYDLAPVGYFILDSKGLVEEVNTAGLMLLESTRAYVKGKHFHYLIAADSKDEYYRFYKHLLSSGNKESCQLKFTAKSGREFYAQVEGTAIVRSSQCYITIVDITEGIEASKTILETKDRLQLALDASAAGTWELHIPSMSMYLDETNKRICNADEERFKDTYSSFISLVHQDDHYLVDQHFRTAINTGSEIDLVCRFLNAKNETCFASIRGHIINSGGAGNNTYFVGIMWDVTEKKRMEEEAERLKHHQQKEIAIATLYAEENERKRISEALHDSVSQLLYGVKIQLNQLNETNRAAATVKLQELLDLAIKETRNISFELAPPILQDFGLQVTLEELRGRLSSSQMNITLFLSGFAERLDLLLEITIFRIIQELINNCMKHSGASLVQIIIKRNKHIHITVKDNGKGFTVPNAGTKPKGTGISSIKSRLNLYNGQLQIDSAPGKGTQVNITLQG